MADKLMCNPNDDSQIYLSVGYIYWFKRLDTQLNKSTNQNSIKSRKRKPDYKTLGTSVVNSPLYPSFQAKMNLYIQKIVRL